MAESGHGKMEKHITDSNLGSSVMPDFSFAFNNKKISDGELRIKVMQDLQRQSNGIAFQFHNQNSLTSQMVLLFNFIIRIP